VECCICGQPAQGICKFCGRAICEDHFGTFPYPIAVYVGRDNMPKMIVVADALICGQCHPQPEPIEMPEIY
jgi:hypothetical protein